MKNFVITLIVMGLFVFGVPWVVDHFDLLPLTLLIAVFLTIFFLVMARKNKCNDRTQTPKVIVMKRRRF